MSLTGEITTQNTLAFDAPSGTLIRSDYGRGLPGGGKHFLFEITADVDPLFARSLGPSLNF